MSQALRELFDQFCNYGRREVKSDLDGANFTKLFRDCKLIDKSSLTTTDIDIIFAKAKHTTHVKTKGQRRINYPQFETALNMIAQKKGMEPEALKNLVCNSEGPRTNATKTDYVKFHDDKNLYTGVQKRKSHAGQSDSSASISFLDTIYHKTNSKSFR